MAEIFHNWGLHGTSVNRAISIEANGFDFKESGFVCFAITEQLSIAHEWGLYRAIAAGDDHYAIIEASFEPTTAEHWPQLPQAQVRKPGSIHILETSIHPLEEALYHGVDNVLLSMFKRAKEAAKRLGM